MTMQVQGHTLDCVLGIQVMLHSEEGHGWDRRCHRIEMHRFRLKLVNYIGNNRRLDR